MDNSKEIVINKLILIGNGFDLALGLKTSYENFLLWLLKKYFFKALEGGEQNAPFEKYKGAYDEFQRGYYKKVVYGYSSNILFDILINVNYEFDKKTFENCNSVESLLKLFETYKIEINKNDKDGLFSKILNQSEFGWVDIEGVYFNLIKDILHKKNGLKLDYIETLNDQLSYIIVELRSYLKEINTDISFINSQRYKNQFNELINSTEILDFNRDNYKSELTYFLNFNYTDSLEKLLNYFPNDKKVINQIHGNINDENPLIVFGFGDEMDKVYKELEELNDNRFFKHIKSFKYFNSSNYRDLIRFLDSDLYQVSIYGHSCGLSDRIMLNEIFEHDNCKSIKVYFYENDNGENDFINKTMEISRHFNSNKLMRKKIVKFNFKNKIPQIKK